jgi:hypothetical protein
MQGATAPTPAPAGAYVSSPASSTYTLCTPGYYTSSSASTGPTEAMPGYFVSGNGATSETPAPRGYYVPDSGATSATAAPIGTYVSTIGAAAPTEDPAGTTTPHIASVAPRSSSLSAPRGSNGIVGPIYYATPSPTIDLSNGPQTLEVTNESTDLGTEDELTALTLISATLSGPEANLFSVNGFSSDTVLYETQSTGIDLSVIDPSALTYGTYSATLTVLTDQSAPFGSPGQSFSYNVTYSSVPEPASSMVSLTGVAAVGLSRRRRRANGVKSQSTGDCGSLTPIWTDSAASVFSAIKNPA